MLNKHKVLSVHKFNTGSVDHSIVEADEKRGEGLKSVQKINESDEGKECGQRTVLEKCIPWENNKKVIYVDSFLEFNGYNKHGSLQRPCILLWGYYICTFILLNKML